MRIDRELNIQNADKRFWTDMYLIISILSLIFIVNNSYHNASSSPPSFIIYHLFTLFKNYKYDFMFWINSYYGYAAVNYFFISGNFYFSFSYSL